MEAVETYKGYEITTKPRNDKPELFPRIASYVVSKNGKDLMWCCSMKIAKSSITREIKKCSH